MKKANSIRLNMLFLSMEKVINGSLTIILIPVIIRAIGIEQYGFWAILLAIFSYMQCMDLGVSFSLERHIAYYHGTNDHVTLQHLVTTSLTYMLLLSLVTSILFFGAGSTILNLLVKDQSQLMGSRILLLCLPAIIANFFQSVFMSIPRGFQLFDISSKIQVGGKFVFAASLLATLFRWKSVYSPMFAYSMQTLFTMTAYGISAKAIAPQLKFFRFGLSVPHLKKLIGFGSKIQISSIAFLVTMHFDKMLLSSFFGLSYVGYYEAATRIIYAVRDIPLFLMSVLTPHISRQLSKNNLQAIERLYRKITGQLTIISFFLMGLLLLNGNELLSLILKSTPTPFSLLVFYLLTIAGFWHVISGGSTYVSRGMGKTSVEMKTNILTLTLNITLSLLFMHLFSFRGVVFGTAAAMIISPFLSYYLTNRLFGFSTLHFIGVLFLPSSAAGFLALLPVLLLKRALPNAMSVPVSLLLFSILLVGSTHLFYTLFRNPFYRSLLKQIPMPGNKIPDSTSEDTPTRHR